MVYLIPERPGKKGGLAHVVASHDGVQDYMDEFIFELGVRAEELLLEERMKPTYTGTGDVEIEIEQGDVDRYLILSDERGQKAALSIEFGRQAYVDDDGEKKGAMEGLFILARATGMRKKKGKKVRL